MGTNVEDLALTAYRAVFDPTAWQSFCDGLSRVTNSRIALHGRDQVSGMTFGMLNSSYDPSYIKTYVAHFSGVSPWMAAVQATPVGVVQRSEEIVPFELLLRTELYNDWLRPQENIATGGGVTLFRDETRLFRLSCNMRMKDREAHQDRMVSVLQALVPHLIQSLALARALAGIPISTGLEQSLDVPSRAILLLDRLGRVAHANKHALKLMRPGGHLNQDSDGRLQLADPAAADRIFRFLAALTRGAVSGSVIVRSEDGTSLTRGTIAPFDPSQRFYPSFIEVVYERRPVAILCLDLPRLSSSALKTRLVRECGLTAAEAEIASLLFEGNRPREIATVRGKSFETVRNQLKTVYSKLNVSSQLDVISVVEQLSHLED